jgi:4-amino-4-deoxy-L-arabinose transferase-like glycosyltransferase
VTHRKKFLVQYFIIILWVLAVLSRFYRIDRESIWLDEAYSFWFAPQADIQHVIKFLTFNGFWWDPHPILYYTLLRYWLKIFGTSEFALRSLSAVFGILVIVLTYSIGKKLINESVGILASLLVLTSPPNLWYSQEVRMYTLTSFLILLSSFFYFKLISSKINYQKMVLYIVSSVLLLYTDYLGIIILFFHIIHATLYSFVRKRFNFKIG